MSRDRSQAEVAKLKCAFKLEHAALYPEDDVTVTVSKTSPPLNGRPDIMITRISKAYSTD